VLEAFFDVALQLKVKAGGRRRRYTSACTRKMMRNDDLSQFI
jgi:hypothetical protein